MDNKLDFKKIKNDVFEEFDYDLNGCDVEIKVIAYICQYAVGLRLKEFSETSANNVQSLVTLKDDFQAAMKSAIGILAAQIDKNQIILKSQADGEFSRLKAQLEEQVYLTAHNSIKQSFAKEGLTLNDQLSQVITQFKDATEDTQYKTASVAKSLGKVMSRTMLFVGATALCSTILSLLFFIGLQNAGWLHVPLEINLDAVAVGKYITNAMGR